jgi:hypothetical protein
MTEAATAAAAAGLIHFNAFRAALGRGVEGGAVHVEQQKQFENDKGVINSTINSASCSTARRRRSADADFLGDLLGTGDTSSNSLLHETHLDPERALAAVDEEMETISRLGVLIDRQLARIIRSCRDHTMRPDHADYSSSILSQLQGLRQLIADRDDTLARLNLAFRSALTPRMKGLVSAEKVQEYQAEIRLLQQEKSRLAKKCELFSKQARGEFTDWRKRAEELENLNEALKSLLQEASAVRLPELENGKTQEKLQQDISPQSGEEHRLLAEDIRQVDVGENSSELRSNHTHPEDIFAVHEKTHGKFVEEEKLLNLEMRSVSSPRQQEMFGRTEAKSDGEQGKKENENENIFRSLWNWIGFSAEPGSPRPVVLNV